MIHTQAVNFQGVFHGPVPHFHLFLPPVRSGIDGMLEAGRRPGHHLAAAPGGRVHVAQGAVWATVNGMQHGETELPGDRLLKEGDSLHLQVGQRLVVESWNPAAEAPVYFSWEPVNEVVWDGRREAASAGAQWRGGVVQPSRDLAQALRSAATAAARLVLGLIGLGDYLVVGRGRAV